MHLHSIVIDNDRKIDRGLKEARRCLSPPMKILALFLTVCLQKMSKKFRKRCKERKKIMEET